MVLLAVGLEAGAIAWVHAERTLYYWDQIGYWGKAIEFSQALHADPVAAWKTLARSVSREELNLLPAAPVGLWMTVAGESRAAFIAALAGLYLFPAIVLLAAVVREWSDASWPAITAGTAVAALLAVPALGTVLKGYVGAGGLLLALPALYLAGRRPLPDWRPWEASVIGVACALVFLFRRWWGFWALALALTVAAELVLLLVDRNGRNLPAIRRAVGRAGLAALGGGVVLVLLAWPRLLAIVRPGYGAGFSAYRHGTAPFHAVGETLRFWGALPLLAVAAGVVLWLRHGDRRAALVLAVMTAAPVGLLFLLQDPDAHHWLVVVPGGMLLIAVSLTRRIDATGRRAGPVLAALALLLTVSFSASVFAPPSVHVPGVLRALFPVGRYRPAVRHDLDEVARLLAELDARQRTAPGPISVLASSGTLCDDVLRWANRSRGWRFLSPGRVVPAAHVDRRDGFPVMLLVSRYVIVTVPALIHLRPEDQRVVLIPRAAILERRNIGRAFSRLPVRFSLDGGVEAFLYERTRPIKGPEVAELVREFGRYYSVESGFFDRLALLTESHPPATGSAP